MPDKRTQTRRPAPISYRPPKGRAAEFRALVKESGLSMNAFITACVFGRSRQRNATQQALGEVLDRTAQIADLLNELSIAGTANAKAIEAAQDELSDIRTALLTLMGRTP